MFEIAEEVPERGMTDFCGISFAASTGEQGQMSEEECERKLAILRACWNYFDRVAARVSAELRSSASMFAQSRSLAKMCLMI